MGQWQEFSFHRPTVPNDSARSQCRNATDDLHQVSRIKTKTVGTLTCCSGDHLLMDALQLMSNEGLTSLAVVDNAFNVVGNISTADVKLLTTTSSLPLLKSSCIHFISVILSERGIGDGQDSFPGECVSFRLWFIYLYGYSVSRQSVLFSCPHSRQIGGNALSPHVGS